jgi:tetratricopeptide (TPR) repeat protein
MKRSVCVFIAIVSSVLPFQAVSQTSPAAVPHHETNFDSERKQADELFLATKPLEALPLYEDLCRQDQTIAVFAERHGAGLLAKEVTLTDPAERLKVHQQAISEIKRAQSLGDNTAYVRAILSADAKTFVGAVVSGIPLSVGYTYRGKPEAQAVFQEAEAAFGRSEWAAALQLYLRAAEVDPDWYAPALCAGDTYFRLKDASNAGIWFAKAIAIDSDRETAYRYWGDALFHAGDRDGAREKFVEAVVAEPYGNPPIAELGQWAKVTGHQLVKPAITRPDFTTPEGALRIDPELAASTQDGRSSWIIYQQYRVAHGARTLNQFIVAGGSDANAVVTPSGYRHTIAEEHAALRALLADIEAKLGSGALIEANIDGSIRNLRILEKANVLGAWIAINAADAGIRSDYPEYRAHHRKHLIEYVNGYLIR